MSNRKAIYVPAADEPSFWCDKDESALPWMNWYKGNKAAYPDVLVSPTFMEIPLEILKGYFNQLSHDLETFDPDNPPSLFIEGTRTIALAWVMWTARRFDITPTAAHRLGLDERDRGGVRIGSALQFTEWAKGFANDFKPRAYITTVNKPKRQSKFRLNLTNDGKNIVVFSDSLVVSRAATISVVLDETVAIFGNPAEFGNTDLLRLMRTLEMSSEPFKLVPWI